MPDNKITCRMSFNEKPKADEKKESRATKLAKAIMEDGRFGLPDFCDINVDLKFIGEPIHIGHDLLGEEYCENVFQVELKEPDDYVSSVLGPNGHAAMQYLDMAEAGHRCMFLVLGSDADVSEAIVDSLKTRYRGQELGYQISSYEKRLIHFESQCEELRCPVDRWKAMPYSRLLSRVHAILTGKSSLAGYGPRPKDNERELIAANCLFRGIGEKTLINVLDQYRVALVPRGEYALPIEEIKGVGKVRAKDIGEKIVMYYDGR